MEGGGRTLVSHFLFVFSRSHSLFVCLFVDVEYSESVFLWRTLEEKHEKTRSKLGGEWEKRVVESCNTHHTNKKQANSVAVRVESSASDHSANQKGVFGWKKRQEKDGSEENQAKRRMQERIQLRPVRRPRRERRERRRGSIESPCRTGSEKHTNTKKSNSEGKKKSEKSGEHHLDRSILSLRCIPYKEAPEYKSFPKKGSKQPQSQERVNRVVHGSFQKYHSLDN